MSITMRRHRYAKIVATLGPASSSPEIIRALFEAGADVFRFNFSHGSHDDHRRRYEIVRAIERETGRPISVLADLQGPKLRIGRLASGPIALAAGDRIRFDLDAAPGTRDRVPLPHPEVLAALAPGVHLLIDDGKMRLEVEEARQGSALARVVAGGKLSERKGVSVVGAVLPLSAVTDKDRQDLAFALDMGADWIALSFVQRPADLDELRRIAARPVAVITKLEKPSAVDELDAIVERSDAVMVARGDLGVEMPPQKVPTIQRRVLRACRKAGKPVIVATQMLESMIDAPTPTRAEASDVATAIYDGADAVMLSAESAAGKFPVEAVRMMSEIIAEVERDPQYRTVLDAAHPQPEATVSDVICDALRRSAAILPVAALVTYTAAGKTALRAARERPAAPILSLTPDLALARRLALVWGTHAVQVSPFDRLSEIIEHACAVTLREGFARPGDTITITGGMPFGVSGGTNLLRVAQVTDAHAGLQDHGANNQARQRADAS
jgi:pyruvate kinase